MDEVSDWTGELSRPVLIDKHFSLEKFAETPKLTEERPDAFCHLNCGFLITAEVAAMMERVKRALVLSGIPPNEITSVALLATGMLTYSDIKKLRKLMDETSNGPAN